MCLAVVAFDAHPRYALVIAANRDEYHARAARPAAWWSEGLPAPILAGRDLGAGGTWLGIDRRGRWAFVTNVREPGRHRADAPTRGTLVTRAIASDAPLVDVLHDIDADGARFNGYNLLAGQPGYAAWTSNRVGGVRPLVPGIHGVSNARLDTPWPKLERVKAGMTAWIAAKADDIAPLFSLLSDRTQAADAQLPATGIGQELEKLLSAPFIISEGYGTRCSTVLTVSREGQIEFVERSFDPTAALAGEVRHRFVEDSERVKK